MTAFHAREGKVSDAAHAIAIPGGLHEKLLSIWIREANSSRLQLTVFATGAD
jgi:hypothetical protein